MSDRFKFRVWDKINDEWMSHQLLDIEKGLLTGFYNDEEAFKRRYIIMQSTGLKDKNGKLIYEGDILGGIFHGYIEYCNECKCFQLKVKDYGCLACEGDLHWYELVEAEEQNDLEVIGNIYENKELLESEG